MVHGLATLRRLNDEAAKRERGKVKKGPKFKLVGGSPATTRQFYNRPWNEAELGNGSKQPKELREKEQVETIRKFQL